MYGCFLRHNFLKKVFPPLPRAWRCWKVAGNMTQLSQKGISTFTKGLKMLKSRWKYAVAGSPCTAYRHRYTLRSYVLVNPSQPGHYLMTLRLRCMDLPGSRLLDLRLLTRGLRLACCMDFLAMLVTRMQGTRRMLFVWVGWPSGLPIHGTSCHWWWLQLWPHWAWTVWSLACSWLSGSSRLVCLALWHLFRSNWSWKVGGWINFGFPLNFKGPTSQPRWTLRVGPTMLLCLLPFHMSVCPSQSLHGRVLSNFLGLKNGLVLLLLTTLVTCQSNMPSFGCKLKLRRGCGLSTKVYLLPKLTVAGLVCWNRNQSGNTCALWRRPERVMFSLRSWV